MTKGRRRGGVKKSSSSNKESKDLERILEVQKRLKQLRIQGVESKKLGIMHPFAGRDLVSKT
jgi:hypothetical protein